MEKRQFYPTKADLNIRDVNISSASGQQLVEVAGLWQFATWEEALKILQLLRSARKRDYEERKNATKESSTDVTEW